MTFYWLILAIDALAVATGLFFHLVGLSDGHFSLTELLVWLALLAAGIGLGQARQILAGCIALALLAAACLPDIVPMLLPVLSH